MIAGLCREALLRSVGKSPTTIRWRSSPRILVFGSDSRHKPLSGLGLASPTPNTGLEPPWRRHLPSCSAAGSWRIAGWLQGYLHGIPSQPRDSPMCLSSRNRAQGRTPQSYGSSQFFAKSYRVLPYFKEAQKVLLWSLRIFFLIFFYLLGSKDAAVAACGLSSIALQGPELSQVLGIPSLESQKFESPPYLLVW